MTLTLHRAPDGAESVTEERGDVPLTLTRIADAPTKKLLDGIEDGVWLRIGGFSYRNDLGMWIIDRMDADPALRYNAVTSSWLCRTHRKEPVFRLSE